MVNLAQQLQALHQLSSKPNVASSIFGSAANLSKSIESKSTVRIGLWPLIAEQNTEFVMGAWTILSYLLEQYEDVIIYRLFAKLDGELDDYEWAIEQSQFSVDDWTVVGLDENIAIWGELTADENQSLKLQVSIEDDRQNSDDTITLSFDIEGWEELIHSLPSIAEKIAETLDMDQLSPSAEVLPQRPSTQENAQVTCEMLLHWERHLLEYLWGLHQSDDESLSRYEHLQSQISKNSNDFALWCLAHAMSNAMLPGYGALGDLFVTKVSDLLAQYPESTSLNTQLAIGLHRLGYLDRSTAILETFVKRDPLQISAWKTLADLYLKNGKLTQAVDTFQRAIEQDAVDILLFETYGDTLSTADFQGIEITDFILIEPDDFERDELILQEAVEAYEEVLETNSNALPVLFKQILLLAELDIETYWEKFTIVVNLDEVGEFTRELLEQNELEDIQPGVDILKAKSRSQPERKDVNINLSVALLQAGKSDEAKRILNDLQVKNLEETLRVEIQRLQVLADDPEFERKLSELTALLRANTTPSSGDIDFLEDVIEKAPSFIDPYLLLAQTYVMWKDHDEALDVLLDAQKVFPSNPDILVSLAQVLWNTGQPELAFNYLNQGLQLNPNHIPLLTRTAFYLLQNNQIEDAKAFILRAETISPNHPSVREIRNYVASQYQSDS